MSTAELVRALIDRMQATQGAEAVPLADIEELQALLELQEAS